MSKPPAAISSSPLALITGAGRGIGQEIAITLAQKGYHCLLLGRTLSALEGTAQKIHASTDQMAALLPLDLSETDKIDTLGPLIAQKYGQLDIFIHAAWHYGPAMPLTHISTPAIQAALKINIEASLRLIRTLSPLLEKSSKGRTVFLTPQKHSETLPPYMGMYYACKKAVETFFSSWSEECCLVSSLKIYNFEIPPTLTPSRRFLFPAEETHTLAQPAIIASKILKLCIE